MIFGLNLGDVQVLSLLVFGDPTNVWEDAFHQRRFYTPDMSTLSQRTERISKTSLKQFLYINLKGDFGNITVQEVGSHLCQSWYKLLTKNQNYSER